MGDLDNYRGLHESTGESFASIADRLETTGAAKKLVEDVRKQEDYSDRHAANEKIRAAGERAAHSDRDAAPAGRTATGKSTT